MPPDSAGTTPLLFGRFRPLAATPEAGFGTACKAFDTLTESPVALTLLKKTGLAAAGPVPGYDLARMREDVRLASRLPHPGILAISGQFEDDDTYCVVSELTGYAPIARLPPLLTQNHVFLVMEVFDKVATVLQFLEQGGVDGGCVGHRNVFISTGGEVKIDHLLSCRLKFLADHPRAEDGPAALVLSDQGAFANRAAGRKLDLLLAAGILKALLRLANKRKAGSGEAAASRSPELVELGRAVMSRIDHMVRRLETRDSADSYPGIAELAREVRAITGQIRTARNAEKRTQLKGEIIHRSYAPGETIFKEGDGPCEEAFIVESGAVQILKATPDGREIGIAISRPGDIVGEMALIDNQPRMATVRAIEPCTVAVITATQFRLMLDKTDPVPRRLIGVLTKRLRATSQELTLLKSALGSGAPGMDGGLEAKEPRD